MITARRRQGTLPADALRAPPAVEAVRPEPPAGAAAEGDDALAEEVNVFARSKAPGAKPRS